MVTELLLFAIVIVLFGFIAWREARHEKLINELTSKLMARDFTEYSVMTKDIEPKTDDRRNQEKKKTLDPVLGGHF